MKLDFKCAGKLVGRFIEVTGFPLVTGRYHYMPYRGPGHLLFQEACTKTGSARCTYETPDGEVRFVARTIPGALGILDIQEISTIEA